MRAESGFKGDVAAGLEGLRDCEGVRRLGAVLGRQGVVSRAGSARGGRRARSLLAFETGHRINMYINQFVIVFIK